MLCHRVDPPVLLIAVFIMSQCGLATALAYVWSCSDDSGGYLFGDLCVNFHENHSMTVRFRSPHKFKTYKVTVVINRNDYPQSTLVQKDILAPKDYSSSARFFTGQDYSISSLLSKERSFILEIRPENFYKTKNDDEREDCWRNRHQTNCPDIIRTFSRRHADDRRHLCPIADSDRAETAAVSSADAERFSACQVVANSAVSFVSAVVILVLLRRIVRDRQRRAKKDEPASPPRALFDLFEPFPAPSQTSIDSVTSLSVNPDSKSVCFQLPSIHSSAAPDAKRVRFSEQQVTTPGHR